MTLLPAMCFLSTRGKLVSRTGRLLSCGRLSHKTVPQSVRFLSECLTKTVLRLHQLEQALSASEGLQIDDLRLCVKRPEIEAFTDVVLVATEKVRWYVPPLLLATRPGSRLPLGCLESAHR
jgi:hypothetical protein